MEWGLWIAWVLTAILLWRSQREIWRITQRTHQICNDAYDETHRQYAEIRKALQALAEALPTDIDQ